MLPTNHLTLLHTKTANTFWQALIGLAAYTYILGMVFISTPESRVVFTKYQVVTMTASKNLIPGFTNVCQVSGIF